MEPFPTNRTSDDLIGTGACAVPEVPTATESEPDGPSAARSSRRAQNARHRANDAGQSFLLRSLLVSLLRHMVEFTFEIGSNLLNEVRRLNALLAERDNDIRALLAERNKAIQDSKEATDALVECEKTIHGLVAERDKAIEDSKEATDALAECNKAIPVSKEARDAPVLTRDHLATANSKS